MDSPDKLTYLTAEGRSLPARILATLVHDRQERKLVRAIVIETLARHAVAQALLDEIVGKSAALDAGIRAHYNLIREKRKGSR